jgi:prepilin-type N-terminal cleavage/methylation domain-containing protein
MFTGVSAGRLPPGPVRLRRAHLHCRAAGMTLVELVVSLAIVSLIMAACGSVVLLASRGLGQGQTTAQAVADGDALGLQITADLASALTITESGAHAVTLTVPGRNGDAIAETIRYSWSGTAGADVTRQYNGGSAAAVAHNVYRFDLTYLSEQFHQ